MIRNSETVGVAVGTNDWVGTQGPLWGRVTGPSVGASQRFCASGKERVVVLGGWGDLGNDFHDSHLFQEEL